MADIDHDDRIDIVMASGPTIVAWNHNGTMVDYFPIKSDSNAFLGPILGHGDDDGLTDIFAGTMQGNIYAYSADGTILTGFPLSAGNRLTVMPAMANIDDDYDYELLAISRGRLMVWELAETRITRKNAWPEYARDSHHSGHAFTATEIPAPSDKLMPENLVYNYPNPTEGSSTTIRYRLDSAAEVTIHIFDLAGELITEMTGPGVAFTDNEVVWDLTGVTSGVYLARVCAKADGKEEVAIIKIAVAK
jgi:hypothetical protein